MVILDLIDNKNSFHCLFFILVTGHLKRHDFYLKILVYKKRNDFYDSLYVVLHKSSAIRHTYLVY